ncbi:MAG: alanine racemase [Patescibacteria group bacterium]|jgi:alanine racemase
MNSYLEIDKQNLLHNISQFRTILPVNTAIAAVVKSNAYGHGLESVATAIQSKVDWFCVVNLNEALTLRRIKIKKPILVLSYYFEKIDLAIKNNISLVVYDISQAKNISAQAKKIKKIAKIHFKVDTGTSRLGIGETEALKLIKQIIKLPNVKIEGIFSHFAASEENQKYTDWQLEKFNALIKKLDKEKITIPIKHFACSAAAMVRTDSAFNMIRLGIGLYGLWPSKQAKKITRKIHPRFSLKPVLTWKTKVIAIKSLPGGTCVGYGCTFKSRKKTKIAVLPVGYYEGYDRHLSNKGEVLINGRRCPVRGRICMNLCIIDITNVKNVKVGDEATLIGDKITADSLAEKIGTINYEVVTRINPLLPRTLK